MRALLCILLLPLLAAGQAFSPQSVPFRSQGTDWARRVVANGGALPSANTISAMETLRTTLIAQGITNKIHALCMFTDSVIASATPLFVHLGYPMWTNNFVAGDLNVNGLKGDGSTKAMETGIRMQDFVPVDGSSGMSLIVTESASNAVNTTAGYMSAAGTVAFSLNASDAGVTRWRNGTHGLEVNTILTNDFGRVGFLSGNRYDNDDMVLFVASPLETHKLIQVKSNAFQADFSTDANTISIFAAKRGTTNESGTFTAQRISMVCIHDALTQAESSNFWWAVKTCREQLGGGTGDPLHDYNRKIVAAGGSAISSTTSNALRDFRAGMDTDDLLYRIVAANCYAPDNLIAARTPFLWQAGHEIWLNNNFGETNVSINGLTGNGTSKSLMTGLSPAAITYGGFSVTSAGISLMIYNATSSVPAVAVEMGNAATAAFMHVQHTGNRLFFYCWLATLVNQDFVTVGTPHTNWSGYFSGNRTAANAIRIDWATNGVHNIATNATGNQTGNKTSVTNLNAHSFWVSATASAANWSDRTISFMSLHPGLTQTQSSNLWFRVAALRDDLGGGLP